MYELTKARRPARAKALIINAFALAIIFADEKKEEKNSFILYTFVKFALVTEQGVNGYVVCIHTQGVATLALGFALVGLSAHSA